MINLDALLGKHQPTVGIDISSASVKLLELAKQGDGYSVESHAIVQIPPNVIVDKEIKDPEVLVQTVEKCLQVANTSATQAVLAVPDSAVISKVITLDASMSEDEMEMQISVEADKYIPFPIDDVSLDFYVLGPSDRDPSLVEVLLAAAKTTVVDARSDIIQDAGLKPVVVDVDSFATERAMITLMSQLPEKGVGKLVGVLDLGAHVSNFTVLEDFRTVFSREEEFGGIQLIQTLQDQYEKTQQEAYQILTTGEWPDGYLENVIEPFRQSTVMQINRAIQFFSSTSQHTDLDALVLAGGIALLPGLIDAVQQGTQLHTILANPFADMSLRKGLNQEELFKQAPTFMACTGLALRAFDI